MVSGDPSRDDDRENLGHVVVQVVVSIEQLVLGAKGDLAEQQDADVV
jgi:hypothetical protein